MKMIYCISANCRKQIVISSYWHILIYKKLLSRIFTIDYSYSYTDEYFQMQWYAMGLRWLILLSTNWIHVYSSAPLPVLLFSSITTFVLLTWSPIILPGPPLGLATESVDVFVDGFCLGKVKHIIRKWIVDYKLVK